MTDRVLEPAPPVLHRYRPPLEIERGWFEDLLIHRRIWASSPKSFNDPYDCQARIDYPGTEAEWRRYYEWMFAKLLPLDKARQGKEVADAMKKGVWNDPSVHAEMAKGLQSSLDNTGIICLCESATSSLMWSRYAAGHRGICLRFRTSEDPFAFPYRVKYTRTLPRVRFNSDSSDLIEAFLLTKGESWQEEAEWRSVGYNRGEGYREIAATALSAVILGKDSDSRLRSDVLHLVAGHAPHLEVLQALVKPGTSELKLEPAG